MKSPHEKALSGGTDKHVLKHLRDQKKARRIDKLVRNAPQGSALRPWSYSEGKYL